MTFLHMNRNKRKIAPANLPKPGKRILYLFLVNNMVRMDYIPITKRASRNSPISTMLLKSLSNMKFPIHNTPRQKDFFTSIDLQPIMIWITPMRFEKIT